MLASETQAIADHLKGVMVVKFGEGNIKEHFADTRDTLCYATHDNQRATLSLLEYESDLSIVVGGYNSSNTSHIVELCEEKLPTYFISGADKIESKNVIRHFNFREGFEKTTENYLPQKQKVKIILTSGASCPDAIVDEVLEKLLSYFKDTKGVDEVIKKFELGL